MNWEHRFLTKIPRRSLLFATGALAGLTLPSRRVVSYPKYSDYPFNLGVASGDPFPDSVVLWTRLAPNPLKATSMPSVNVPVQWQVSKDENMSQVVAKGEAIATPDLAHSVRVVVWGLEPNRWYWYQFKAGNEVSPIGRTRTAPAINDSLPELAFAFVSCQNYAQGYYNAYRHLAAEELNFVLHLGDYIYESPFRPDAKTPRNHVGTEPIDLDGYRQRYGLYKSDRDLQAAHAAFPFICTWDDHEVDNDYANVESQDFMPVEQFLRRRAAAYQAYYEHMPLRPLSRFSGNNLLLYRKFTFGNLAEFNLLDTRQYRSDQACDDNGRGGGQLLSDCAERLDPKRTMLGEQQERWLFSSLERSPAIWNVIAQQYLVAQLKQKSEDGKMGFWSDGWDGYPASRNRILEFIKQRRLSNPIFLGGDIHSFWVSEIKQDFDNPNSEAIASEFVGTSISSNGVPYERFAAFLPENPHIKFFESRLRGYVRCSVNPQQWLSDLRVVDTVASPIANVRTLVSYAVENGKVGPQKV